MTRLDDAPLRRYLLGAASDEEAEHIEQEYFAEPDALDQLAAVENDLIDEYVAGSLTPAEREAFDVRYRDSPRHHVRLAVSRGLRGEAAESRGPLPIESRRPRPTTVSKGWPLFARVGAAAAIVAVAVNVWLVRSTLPTAPPNGSPTVTPPPDGSQSEPPSPGQPVEPSGAPATPRSVALVLSPIHTRTAGAAATLSIPSATDLVVVRLQGEGSDADLSGAAVVRTVSGAEIWRGPAVLESGQPPDARLDIPAALLRADDYVIDLLGTDPAGREIERYSYFFSVRQNER